ncbi:hypothetical protein JOC95_001624 [Bacillus tianshenii]|uniref:Uncharacterized protein n=1 Tax=Sutcliffiella tianshenii TaxID=1463404 RepID=A0ABS2NZD4_9BACI|nr:hypothetical protein [Bacillus tianshenii]MBM7619772.1 hypothetical protein [Bacillus tianshenii]
MAKIPIKPIVQSLKTNGPTFIKFVKNNWKELSTTAVTVSEFSRQVVDRKKNKKESNQENIHYRKARYTLYKTDIMNNLDAKKRTELFQYKLEVEQFLQQIKDEEKIELAMKKPIHSKRMKNWDQILIQIEGKMVIKDYQEYLLVYHSPNYQSAYFEGYEGQLEKFKRLIKSDNTDELYDFFITNTKRSKEDIQKDFSL